MSHMSERLYEQLMAIAAYAAEHRAAPLKYNPKPVGMPFRGSGTDIVEQELRRVYPASLPFSEIRRRTGLGRGCVSWALQYLEHIGRIEVVHTQQRRGHGIYQQYRAKDR